MWWLLLIAVTGIVLGMTCCFTCTTCLACDAGDVAALGIDVTVAGVTGSPVCVGGSASCASRLNVTFHLSYVSGAGTSECVWYYQAASGIPGCTFFSQETIQVTISCNDGAQRIEGELSVQGASGNHFFETELTEPLDCSFGPVVVPWLQQLFGGNCNSSAATMTVEAI